MKLDTVISKEKFVETYKKYSPKKWIVFAFKYFSKETEAKNMKLSNTITYILLGLFLVGMIATILDLPRPIIGIATIAFGIVLSILVFFLLAAVWSNNRRIKKIAKDLGISLADYNDLADRWKDEIK